MVAEVAEAIRGSWPGWPKARYAAWRVALYEAIRQDCRNDCNKKSDGLTDHLTIRGPGIPGLSAATDVAVILRDLARARIAMGIGPYLAAELISAAREQLSGRPGFGGCVEPSFLSRASAG